ncbi:unnamed protein product [Phyllotreta striolata]|uniref:Carboxylesterase type B domain-containing protein n=1 Tax=Phyllotreta striolata TaxID=444603 RepID=A0A9N9TZ18_PHYSR|nr:unnamed protein product [Phyllotreta striolata]
MLSICRARHRFIKFYFAVLMLASPVHSGPRYSSRIVDIQSGAIRGVILELNSRHLEPVEVFRGVPYAAPPVGPLRFRPPQPPVSWPGTRLADSFGAACPQKYPDVTNRTAALQFMPKGRYAYLRKLVPLLANQSEDCLFLNIYVPGSGNRGLEAPYAVLVFIHGESFEWGAGHPYDGSVLASYGHVIVITLNFRLGILGFLRTQSSNVLSNPAPPSADKGWDSSGGNLGLKDIAAALHWIKANIAAFGGDPERVTLLGHDTGAALANLLFLSPTAKGLFRRVVLLSGTALSPWATVRNADGLRISVGQQTGCLPMDMPPQEEDNVDIAACLRSRPLQVLLDVELEKVRFMPRIAPSLPVDSLSVDPAYAMEHASENFITCEVMLGTTTTESYGDFSANDIQYGFEEDQRNRVLRTYIRNAYVYHLNEIFSAVKNEYTDWDKPIQHPINIRDSTMEALSDGHTVSPLVRVAYLHARRGAKTFFFHFGYQTKDSDYPQRLGSIRGEDITYVLGLPLVGGQPHFPQNFSRQDLGVAEAMLGFVGNFAKSGDPNAPTQSNKEPDYGGNREKTRYKGLVWESYEIGTQYYLSFTSKPKMKSHYRGHKMAVWLNLIPQLHQPGDDDVTMRHHHFHEREPHYYAGAVRMESFTRLPPPLHPASMTDSHSTTGEGTECIPNTTADEGLTPDPKIDETDEDSEEFLQRLATRHYYSYTAALGVTVGVGCLLLVLNMLIFAGIYYQRERDRRRHTTSRSRQNRSNSTPSTETIPMSQRPSTPGSSARQSPVPVKKEKTGGEFPPSYTMVPNSLNCSTLSKREKPPPPVRTSSVPGGGTVKKRVQIQEISV